MIKYSEWKSQFITEASIEDPRVQELITKTAQDIAQLTQSFIDTNTPPAGAERALPPKRVALRKPAIAQTTAIPSEVPPQQVVQPKFPDAINNRIPKYNDLPWYKRWFNKLTDFANMKENRNVENLLQIDEFKDYLAEEGIMRFFLIEANLDFNELSKSISDKLNGFVAELNKIVDEPEQTVVDLDKNVATEVKKKVVKKPAIVKTPAKKSVSKPVVKDPKPTSKSVKKPVSKPAKEPTSTKKPAVKPASKKGK